ncbi:peroxiredoxin family protein [Flexithrix dorotheae]|uniref:peroxiredoxin family protein n=1 Tax=Flexithrix dorotheae TaxID=70993 RepID=UPI000372EBFB|nr:TlpA disulfide reductase family protein [Flexithrix dorotheae]
MHTKILLIIWTVIFLSCQEAKKEYTGPVPTLKEGVWRAELSLNDTINLPFNFSVSKSSDSDYIVTIINGEERIELEEVTFNEDSVIINILAFDTEIHAKVADNLLTGVWIKNGYAEPYIVPFKAEQGKNVRFVTKLPEEGNVSGNWDATFFNKEGPDEKAVGIFSQRGEQLTGTFLTPLGDYRYLAGVVDGPRFKLSCFDGSHAFLFTADIHDDSLLVNGEFFSGTHWYQKWTAVEDDSAKLPDPNSLTFLKEGYDELAFEFPNLEGEIVSLTDDRYKDKVVVVQLMGSWCPNCMDETIFLSSFYDKYKSQGFEVIGLAYERSPEFEKAKPRVEKMMNKFKVNYEVLIAGTLDKEEAAKTLPMLNHVISFPTAITIDKNGKVRNIHTGFSGPGTGKYYDQYVDEFTLMIEKLLEEDNIQE